MSKRSRPWTRQQRRGIRARTGVAKARARIVREMDFHYACVKGIAAAAQELGDRIAARIGEGGPIPPVADPVATAEAVRAIVEKYNASRRAP